MYEEKKIVDISEEFLWEKRVNFWKEPFVIQWNYTDYKFLPQ